VDLDDLHLISNGFIKAKVVLAAAELGLFEITAGEGVTAVEAAERLDGELRGMEILLDALVAIEILDKRDDRYRLRAELEPLLREDAPSQTVAMLRHRNRMFRDWSRLEDRIRGLGPASGSDRELLHDPRANRDFIRAMLSASGELAPSVVDRIDLAGVRRVADLGGGPGHYAVEFASRNDAIEVWLIDLPLTLETARELEPFGLKHDRVHTTPWDFYGDPPPADLPSFDLVFLSQVMHAESSDRNRALLGTIERLLGSGGRLVIHEFFVDSDRTSPAEAALFAVNMLAMTPGGRTYTVQEVEEWARDAGLDSIGFEQVGERSGLATFRRFRSNYRS
jgi:SAM-dependent methyltransferase